MCCSVVCAFSHTITRCARFQLEEVAAVSRTGIPRVVRVELKNGTAALDRIFSRLQRVPRLIFYDM